MLWLEMSRDITHGGGAWGFTRCLWSPSRKQAQGNRTPGKWPYWEALLDVQAGDTVLHLRDSGKKAAFVGFSIASTDGYETTERPPVAGPWGYAKSFYRVPLADFSPFPDPIPLQKVFADCEDALLSYFFKNDEGGPDTKRRIFFVLQADRLQCLNGAYLSEVDDDLAAILLGPDFHGTSSPRPEAVSVQTGEHIRELATRVGQSGFSDSVRRNFGSHCCFPGCSVVEQRFLVGSHIARWADNPELRGQLSNGLCLCLMHDKAFEDGLFTIDGNYCVKVHEERVAHSEWSLSNLLPFSGQPILVGKVKPSQVALRLHWTRTGFPPEATDGTS